MRTFRQVAAAGGFAAAGRDLGRATSSVSRQIAELEAALGTRLFNRSTRRLSLTEAGEIYHERVLAILNQVDDAQLAVAHVDGAPTGVLRATVPTAMGQEVIDRALPGFLARFPGVRIVLNMSDSLLDLYAARIDVAVRIGRQSDSSLVARKIGDSRRVICASPAYLKAAPPLRHPDDLRHHNCLTFRTHPGHNTWSFRGPGGTVNVPVTGNMFIHSADGLGAAAVAGIGLVLLPDWTIGAALRARRLRPVLPDYQVTPAASPIYAVYPPTPYVAPKVRVFIDYLRDNLAVDAGAA